MEEFIWVGEMDCGWEDLAVKVKTESIKFTEVMLDIGFVNRNGIADFSCFLYCGL